MTVTEFMEKYGRTCKDNFETPALFAPIFCKDGSSLSVQAGLYHNSSIGYNSKSAYDYETVEVHTDVDDGLLQMFKNKVNCMQYDFVPVSIVNTVISEHGDIDIEKVEEYIRTER